MRNLLYLFVFSTLLEFGYFDSSVEPGCTRQEKAFILMDIAKDYITKANDLNPRCIVDDVDMNCERGEKSTSFLEMATNLISEAKKAYPNVPESVEITTVATEVSPILRRKRNDCDCKCPKHPQKPVDCSEILQSGHNKSGVYTIFPRGRTMWNRSVDVYCDMDTNGGGWTVIQRRGKFSTPKNYFLKTWAAYKDGFGNITEEFWIGNENLYTITNQAHYAIRFDLVDARGEIGFAQYHTFFIKDEESNYKLHIEGYTGNVGDSMNHNHNQSFSTIDRDNDKYSQSCASLYDGAWWYDNCHAFANLNGLNMPGEGNSDGMTWHSWREYVALAGVEMKLRPWKIPNY